MYLVSSSGRIVCARCEPQVRDVEMEMHKLGILTEQCPLLQRSPDYMATR